MPAERKATAEEIQRALLDNYNFAKREVPAAGLFLQILYSAESRCSQPVATRPQTPKRSVGRAADRANIAAQPRSKISMMIMRPPQGQGARVSAARCRRGRRHHWTHCVALAGCRPTNRPESIPLQRTGGSRRRSRRMAACPPWSSTGTAMRAPGRARGDRRGRGPARYRHDRQGAAGPYQDQMGPCVPRLRRVRQVLRESNSIKAVPRAKATLVSVKSPGSH